jgi:hypothetical protein
VASNQVNRGIDAGHSTTILNLHYPLLEKPSSPAGNDQGFAIGIRDQRIGLDRGFDVMLPRLQVCALGLCDRLWDQCRPLARNQFGFVAYNADQDFGQRRQYLRQVYRCKPFPDCCNAEYRAGSMGGGGRYGPLDGCGG